MAQKKRERIKDRRLNTADKIIAATLAASTVLSPISAVATELTVHDSYKNHTKVTTNGNKHTVTTDKKNGESAFNRFSKFSLSQGDIANMVLPSGTSKLYNFVDAQIDVQGTVNALKAEAKKIGGHLIFISPKGMIIGPQGAINAGKFSAIIADDKTYNAITSGDAPWDRTEFQRMEAGYVALNPEGSIVVQGRVTAPDGITLKAAQIKTEKRSDGKPNLDTSKTVKFSDLVNMDVSGDGAWILTEDQATLTRTDTGTGDVRIEALAVPSGDVSEALIEHAGDIRAAGSVIMRARAIGSAYSVENDSNDLPPFTPTDVKPKVAAKAKVHVKKGATVSADKSIVVSADVWNFRTDATFAAGIISIDKNILPAVGNEKFDASYSDLKAEAEIVIESGAKLAASEDLTLHAGSTVGVMAGTTLDFLKLISWPMSGDTYKVAAAGAIVSKQSGSAKITVSGDISASRDINIDANSTLTTELNAFATSHDQNKPPIALLWAELDNNAAVSIDASADVKAGGNLTIGSSAGSSITTEASSRTSGDIPGGTALNATIVATGAQTAIGANLTAGGTVTITATDETDTWSVTANNRTSTANLFEQKVKNGVKPSAFQEVYKNLASSVDLPDFRRYGGADADDYKASADKWGFAVLYTGVRSTDTPTQSAGVVVMPGVSIVAPDDITISSEAVVSDHHWITRSEVGGSSYGESDLEDTYSFAVNYASPMLASTAAVGGQLTSTAGSIDIESSARVEWNRVSRLINRLKQDGIAVGSNFADLSAWANAAGNISSDVFSAKNWQGFKPFAKELGLLLGKTALYMAGKNFASLIPDVMSFADLSSYANVYSQAVAVTQDGGTLENAGSGSFAMPSWIVGSTVEIVPGAALAAGGSLNVNGSTRSDIVLLGGINNNLLGGDMSTAEKPSHQVGVGGTNLITSFITENNINVHRGAVLLSSTDITAMTDDSSMQLVLNLLGAKPGEKGIGGQLNVLVQSQAGRVNIDDEATLAAPALTIHSEANNYITNIALAYQNKIKSFGFAAGIDVLNFENTARVADFDETFSDDVQEQGPVEGAFIAADAINIGAFTHAHVNTIAAAGAGASSPSSGDHWYDKLKTIPDLPLKGSKKLSEWIGSKITGTATRNEQSENDEEGGNSGSGSSSATSNDQENAPENTNIEDAANNGMNQASNDIVTQIVNSVSSDDNNALDDANDDDDEDQEQHTLNLARSGSVAWNFVDYVTHAGLEGTEAQPLTIKSYAESSGGTSNRVIKVIKIEAQADKWQAAFSGSAAVALVNDEEEGVKSVGVAGTVSVNSGKSVVSADLGNAVLVALDTASADRDAVSVSAGSTGRSVAAALGFDLSEGSEESDVSVAANVSVNTLNNTVRSTVTGVTTSADNVARPVSTDLDVFSYAKDTQVTGGIDVAVAKGDGADRAVGAGVEVAVVKNDLASTIENSTLNNLGAVSIDSYLGITQVVAGVAVAAGSGREGSWAGAGAFVVDTLINKAAANVKSSDITASGNVHIAAGDGADIGSRIDQNKAVTSFDLEVQRTGASIDAVISSDTYHKGVELETEDYYTTFITDDDDDDDDDSTSPTYGDTTHIDDKLSGRTGMTVVTAALAGSGTVADGIVGVGTAVVVNNLRNTMTVSVDNSSITAAGLNANSENGAALVGVAAGASVGGKGAAANGSVVWNSIVNKADTKFQNSNITITGTSASSLTAQNRALSVGVAGAVGAQFKGHGLALGFSLGYSHITNDAVVSVTGGATNKTLSGAGGALSAHAENSANSWLVAAAAGGALEGASAAGTGSLHRITGETSSVFDGMTVGGLRGLSITADEDSSAKTLSGHVSISTKHAAAGASIAWTQVGVVSGNDQAHTLHAGLKNSTVTMANKAGALDVSTGDDASILTVAVGGGFGYLVSANAVVAVNQLHRRDLAEIVSTNLSGAKTAVSAISAKSADIKNISVVIPAGSTAAGGGSVNVNRIGDTNQVLITGTNAAPHSLDIGSLYSRANSGMKILNVGVGGGGAATGAGAGIVIVNSMSPSTDVTIEGVTVRAQNSLAAQSMSDAEIRNYSVEGIGAGVGAGTGLVEVNYINDTTTTSVKNASLTVLGSADVSVSNDIDDGTLDNTKLIGYLPTDSEKGKNEQDSDEYLQRVLASHDKMPSKRAVYDNAFQGMFDPNPLRTQRTANTYKGLVIDASSTHVLTDAAIVGGGAGAGIGVGQVNVDLLTGSTSAQVIDSDLASSGDAAVHAADFSNVSGAYFTGAGAGAGAGAGIVNVRSAKRLVDASIRSTSLDNKHTLNVTGIASAGAVSKQSLTTFAITGAGAGVGSGALLVEVDVQRGTTSADITGMKGTVGGLSTAADHFTRIGQIEIAGAGAGMGSGAVLVSVGVDKSTTVAQVRSVSLDVTGGNVVIDARNRIKGYNVTAQGAGGMGSGAIGVGVNHNQATIDASLKDSVLGTESQRAGSVLIGAHNDADLLTVAAVGSGGMGSGNILVNIENLYSDVAVNVTNSRVYARNIAVSADEDYKLRAHAWGASGGVGAGLVYVQAMNIGEHEPFSDAMYDSQLNSINADQASALDMAQKFVNGESLDVRSNVLSAAEAQAVQAARANDADIRQSRESTMHINIAPGSVLDASENITVAGVESTDILSYQGGFTGGVGAGAVNLSFMSVRKQNGVVIDTAKLNAGGTISISSVLTGNNNQHVIQGIGGVGTLFAAYGRLKAFSGSTITAKSADITGAQGVSLSALDTTIQETYGAGGTLSGGSIGGIVARTIISDDVWVKFDGGKLQSAGGTVSLNAKRGGETYAQEVFGYLTGLTGLGADAKASENTNVSVSVGKDDHANVSADKFAVHSELNPYVHAKVHEHGGGGITVGVPLTEAVVDGSSTVTLGANNAYDAKTLTVEAFVGDKNAPLHLLADTNGHGGSVGIDFQYGRAEVTNDTTAKIIMNGGTFSENAALNLHAWNNAALSADVRAIRIGVGVAASSSVGRVYNFGKAEIELSGSSEIDTIFGSLNALAESTSDSRIKVNGDGGGALALGKPAWSVTSIDNKATVDIAGVWTVSGDMDVHARQRARTDDWTDAVIGGAIAGNRNTHDLLLDGVARVTVAQDAGLYAGGALTLEAENVLVDNPENHYNVSGNTYGAVAGNGSGNDIVIRQSADIVIGRSADVSGYENTTLIAHSSSDINEYSRVVSGGVGAGSGANLDFDGTWSNTITIESDATVGHFGLHPADVNIAAWNDANLRLTSVGNLQAGLIGGATSRLKANVTRNNTITVWGNVESDRDINIRAGRRLDGFGGELKMTDLSQAYAHAIGGASASIERNVYQNNIINIYSGAKATATRDVNLLTRPGDVTISEFVERYAWIGPSKKAGSIVSTAMGHAVDNLVNQGTVTVNGTVEAGAKSRFTLHVSDGFAMLEKSGDVYRMIDWVDGKMYLKRDTQGNYIHGTNEDKELVLNGSGIQTPTITKEGFGEYALGMEREYDTYLYERLEELDKLIEATADQSSSTAHLSYVTERAQIISTLQYYGLPTNVRPRDARYDRLEELDKLIKETTDHTSEAYQGYVTEREQIIANLQQNGLPTTRPEDDSRSVPLMVPYLWISPITVSGGNITIEADVLHDGMKTGMLKANGSPKIEITNDSNLSLVLNGLWVLAPGGEVFVNSVSVSDDNDLRARVAAAKLYDGKVIAEGGDGASPDITVINSYPNTHVDFRMADTSGNSADISFTVISDIENHGDVINYPGRVKLSTSVGSIRSVGADIVGGKGIELHAPRGSISITSHGILHIDGTPENVWWSGLRDYTNALVASELNDGLRIDDETDPVNDLLAKGTYAPKPGHIVSGGNIFITASVINVNGTIQSGFGTYKLSLGNEWASSIDYYDGLWAQHGSTALNDRPSQLSGYRLTSYDIVYDPERDEFIAAPASWYNPSTRRIVMDDITSAGGSIYLTGKIINTNFWDSLPEDQIPAGYEDFCRRHSGRIIAYTGAAEVIIDSQLDTTLRLGRVDTKSNMATIVINDMAKAYANAEGVIVHPYDDLKIESPVPYETWYAPKEGLRYFYNAEKKAGITRKVAQYQTFDWWADSWDDDRAASVRHYTHNNPTEATLLPGGSVMTLSEFLENYIASHPNEFNNDGLNRVRGYKSSSATLLHLTVKSSDIGDADDQYWYDHVPDPGWIYNVDYNNWTHFAGTISRTAVRSFGTKLTVTEALKADNPINVSVRRSTNAGNITVTAPNADVLLADELRTNEANAVVSITAKNIIAGERALVNADDVQLTASEHIARERPLILDPLGDVVYVKATAGDGKSISLAVPDGGASVDLKTTGGTIDLTTDLSIAGRAEAATMTLKSDFGSIGSADTAFVIAGAGITELTVTANETINIAKTNGDLAVVRAETPGDVTLETKDGSIVNPRQTKKRGMSDEEWVKFWKDAELISADGKSITDQVRDELVANVENAYRTELSTYQMAKTHLASDDAGQLELTNKDRAYLESIVASLDKYANVTNVSDYQAQIASIDVQLQSAELTEKQRVTLQKQKEALQNRITALSKDGTIDIKDYIEQQKQVTSSDLNVLVTIDAETIGGWTANYLLYAVQDAILNPGPGTVQADLEPVIIGKTVTLKASVNVGSEDAEVTIPGGAALNDTDGLENLKKLAAANPADVTWRDKDENSGEFVINETHMVAIDASEAAGAKAGEVIAIASPKRDLVLTSVESTGGGKVFLMAGGDVLVSDKSTADAVVKGGDMFIAAAGQQTDIGSADRPLTVEQAANLTLRASAGRSVYLTAASGDLSLGSIAAKQDLFVTTSEDGKGIFMSEGQGRLDASDIRLTTNNGNIGSQDAPIRVQNAASNDFSRSVTVSGASNVYMNGENDLLPEGWLNLNGATIGSADIRSEGGLAISGDMIVRSGSSAQFAAADDIIVSHKLTGGDLTLSADYNVTVKGETSGDAVTVRSGSNTTLADVKAGTLSVSVDGTITTAAVTANNAELTASGDVNVGGNLTGGDISLTSQNKAVNVSGDVSADTLAVTAHDTVELKKSVTVAATTTLNSTAGDVIAGGDLKTDTLTANARGSVTAKGITVSNAALTASNDVTVTGDLTGSGLKLSADAKVTVSGTTTADKLTISSGADTKLGEVKAGSADIIAGRSIDIAGKLTGGDLLLSADGYVTVSGATSADELTIRSGKDMKLAEVKAGSADLSGVNIVVTDDLTAGTLTAAALGDLTAKQYVNAGSANITAGGDIRVGRELTGGDLSLSADKNVTVGGRTIASTLTIKSGADTTLAGVRADSADIIAGKSIEVKEYSLTDTLTGGTMLLSADENVTVKIPTSVDKLTVRSGSDTSLANVKAITLEANAGGSITTKGVTTGTANFVASADVTVTGNMKADELTIRSGTNTTLDYVLAGTLEANAGGSITTKTVTAESATLVASSDVTVKGYLNGGNLTLSADKNVTVVGQASADKLTFRSGADTKLADVKANTLDASAGGSITTKSVAAETAKFAASNDVIVTRDLTGGDLTLSADEYVTVSGTTSADTLTITSCKDTKLAEVKADSADLTAVNIIVSEDLTSVTLTVNAAGDFTARQNVTADSADIIASHDIGISNSLTGGDLLLSADNAVSIGGTTSADELTIRSGADMTLADVKAGTLDAKTGGLITTDSVTAKTADLTAKGDVTAKSNIDAETLTVAAGRKLTTQNVTAQTADLTAKGDVTAKGDINADALTVAAGKNITTQNVTVSDAAKIAASNDIAVSGNLTGGELDLTSGRNTAVSGTTNADTLTITSGADTKLADVKADFADIIASHGISISSSMTGGEMLLSADENVTVSGTTSADTLMIMSGKDTKLAEVKADSADLTAANIIVSEDLTAGTLTANAAGDFTALQNVKADSADIIASHDIDISGSLTGGDLLLSADNAVSIDGTTSADELTIRSGADLTLADVKAGTHDAKTGGSITTDSVTAKTADLTASGDITANGDINADTLIVAADKNITTQNVTAKTADLTASGDITANCDINAETLTAAAGKDITTQNVTADKAEMTAKGDVTANGSLTGGTFDVTAEKGSVTMTDANVETLNATAGKNVMAENITVSDAAKIAVLNDITVSGNLTGSGLLLSADENVAVSGTTSAGFAVTITSGADTRLAEVKANQAELTAANIILSEDLTAAVLKAQTSGDFTAQKNVTADDNGEIIASKDITVSGNLTGSGLLLSADENVTVSGTTSADELTIRSSADLTLADVKAGTLDAKTGGSITTDSVTAKTVDLTAKGDVTANGDINADTLTVAVSKDITTQNVKAKSADLNAKGDVTANGDIDAETLTAVAGKNITTQNVTVSDAAKIAASNDITVSGKLTGGELDLTSGRNTAVSGTTSGNTMTIASGADTQLADVKANTLDANAGGSITTASITVNSADLTAKGNVTANGDINADVMIVAAGRNFTTQNVTADKAEMTASGDMTANGDLTGGTFDVTAEKGSVTMADADVDTLTAAAGTNVTAENVTVSVAAKIAASNDITVNGKLTGGELELTSGRNTAVSGTTSGDAVTITSGADTTLADVKANTLDANAGGSITTDSVTAKTADLIAKGNVTAKGDINADTLTASAGENITTQNVTAKTADLAAMGDVTANGDINADALTVAAGRNIMTQNVTAKTAEMYASRDVTANGSLTGDALDLTAGRDLTVNGTTKAQKLTAAAGANATFAQVLAPSADVTAGKSAMLADESNDMGDLSLSASTAVVRDSNDLNLNVRRVGDLDAAVNGDLNASFDQPANNVSMTSRGGSVDIITDITANDLTVNAKKTILARKDMAAAKGITLNSSGDVTADGTITTHDLTADAGEDATFNGSIDATGSVRLTSRNGSVTAEENVTAGDLTIAAKGDAALKRDIDLSELADVRASNDVTVDGTIKAGSANLAAGNNITMNAALVRDDLNGYAGENLNVLADTESGGNTWLSAHEISARNLTAGKFLTALSDTTFTGNDLTAGGDVRVHSYGDMTFNDAKAGDNAWILGLGSSALRMKFHTVSAPGLDTAVLVERGYLDYWKVTAGLDGATAVRHFEGPKVFGSMKQGSKIRVFFPFGGSLMPKDPFNFHVIDLLQNIHLLPFEREAVRMWPPRKPNLHVGSDDIDVNLDEYNYWLPEEVTYDAPQKALSVSSNR